MPALTRVLCDDDRSRSSIGYREHCPPLDLPVPESLGALDDALAAAGWIHDEQGFHCPQHDPSALWFRVRLSSGSTIEPLPGMRLRLRSDLDGGAVTMADAQIHFDPARFDVEDLGEGVWRAKATGTRWPTEQGNAHE